jgi:hypothetical protein
MRKQAGKIFEQIQHGKSCLNPAKRDEFFSRKAKIISGNFQQRAIFLWLLSFDRSKESNE